MPLKIPSIPLRKTAIAGAIAGGVVFAVAGGLRLVLPSHAQPGDDIMTNNPKNDILQKLAQFGNCNTFGPNNGSINNNCNNTTINQAPALSIQTVEKTEQTNADGSYSQNFHIRVNSPYAAKQLIVGAKAPNLVDVDLTPDGAGIMVNVRKGSCGDQCLGVQIGAPVVGDYWVHVVTKAKEDTSLLWNVQ